MPDDDIVWVQSDTASALLAECKKNNATKDPIDLTGQTVALRYKISGGALQTKSMTVQSPATAGKARYQWLASELTPGIMEGEVQLTDAASKVITQVIPFIRRIRARLI